MQNFNEIVALGLRKVDLGDFVPVISSLQLVDHLVELCLWRLIDLDRDYFAVLSRVELTILDGDLRKDLALDKGFLFL